MQKYTIYACLCTPILLLSLLPTFVFAETNINDGYHAGPVWNEAGSPYIIEGPVTIKAVEGITIEPGTTIMSDSNLAGELYFDGDSIISGTADKPIIFSNIGDVYVDNGNFLLKNVNFQNVPLGIYNATATIDRVSSSGADTAMFIRKSAVNASDVSISSSTEGINSIYAKPVLIGSGGFLLPFLSTFSSFLTHKALAQTTDDPGQNHITIHDSSFNNTKFAIYNSTRNLIHAENDWWGSIAGPAGATSNMIYGPVSYDPWQGKSAAAVCCSSVLFVPGLEASRLSIDNRRIFGTSTDQLWEPISNIQVQGLYLDQSGNSIQTDIHPTGLVDTALAIQPIYQKFINVMDGLVSKRDIVEWKSYPYDWRLPLEKVVAGSIGSSTVVKTIEEMASSSKTGKVTIIAHSNGGLVTKLVYNSLKDKGEEKLVDKIIFVAVPEIGTPQAVPSLLHGDGEEIANGYILSTFTARGLGVNMPSAYSLLPDQSYFSLVPNAMISFASSTMAGLDFSKYFPAITTYSGLKSFITDKYHGSLSDSTDVPIQGNSKLFSQAESVHTILDSWKPASSTELVAIAGWGLPTDIGINYFQKFVCATDRLFRKMCKYDLQLNKNTPRAGDGTVTVTSSLYSSSTKQVFNIGAYDLDKKQNLTHADIFEADPIDNAIKQDLGIANSSENPPYITSSIPTDYKFPDDLTINVHSPADLNIYDKYGNHTGPIPNPIPGSDLDAYEKKIPGSFYEETGDGVQVILPFDPSYKINLDGTGMGGVTVDTSVTSGDAGTIIASSSFVGMIVTPITHMEFAQSTSTNETDAYRTIKIDEDGDGIFDATATPDSMPDISPEIYKSSIENCIRALKLPSTEERSLLDRLAKAWKFAEKDKSGRAEKATKNLSLKRFHHIKVGKISDQNRKEMREMIEGVLNDMGI